MCLFGAMGAVFDRRSGARGRAAARSETVLFCSTGGLGVDPSSGAQGMWVVTEKTHRSSAVFGVDLPVGSSMQVSEYSIALYIVNNATDPAVDLERSLMTSCVVVRGARQQSLCASAHANKQKQTSANCACDRAGLDSL